MNFSKRGAATGFIAGASGGAVAGPTDFSLIKATALAAGTAILVALLVNLIWKRRS